MAKDRSRALVLGIAPTSRGFGYVVFESERSPVDWGVKEIRADKNRRSLLRAEALLGQFQPHTLVLEDWRGASSRRSARVRRLLHALAAKARHEQIEVCRYSRRTVRAVFSAHAARSKDDVAAVIADRVPALAPALPRRRRLWQSERYGMAVFEAAALVMSHYALEAAAADQRAKASRTRDIAARTAGS